MACCGKSTPRIVHKRSTTKKAKRKQVVRAAVSGGGCPKCGSQTRVKYTRSGGSLRKYLSCLRGHITYG